jgi:hypothetical protein
LIIAAMRRDSAAMAHSVIRLITATTLVAILALPSRLIAQSNDREADRKAIRAHIESIFAAFIAKDRPKLRQTHGSEWRGFTPWSPRPIRGVDLYMNEATFPEGLPKDQGMIGYQISDFDIVFYGDTAVVSFVAEVERRYGTATENQKINLLDVYHKDRGGWIQVASNTSLHPEALEDIAADHRELDPEERASLMKSREDVWRTWFAGDTAAFGKLVPPELVTIDGSSSEFGSHESEVEGSRRFAQAGGKLTRLAFPRTEVQAYGNTAILYTTFEMDLAMDGKVTTERGAATEIFVKQKGRWVNTGWQLATAR